MPDIDVQDYVAHKERSTAEMTKLARLDNNNESVMYIEKDQRFLNTTASISRSTKAAVYRLTVKRVRQ
jgi:hypothetical protein